MLVTSYLAHACGSGEPEVSVAWVKDLEQFLQECRAFQIDHTHDYSTPENRLGDRVEDLRWRLEEMLGNINLYVTIVHPCIHLRHCFLIGRKNSHPLLPLLLS